MKPSFFDIFFKNLGTKLVSLIVAVILWFVVLNSRNVEESKEVPIDILTPSHLVVANEIPDRVTFRISGPKAFLRAVMNRKEQPIRINLTGAKAGLITYRFFSDSIQLPLGVKVQTISPTAILVKLEEEKSRTVPIKAELSGQLPEGLKIKEIQISPQSVLIKGAQSQIRRIGEVYTTPIDVSQLTEDFDKEVSLEPSIAGVQVGDVSPRVRIKVENARPGYRLKGIKVTVLSAHSAELKENTVTLFVRGAPSLLSRLDTRDVSVIADLRGKPKGVHLVELKVSLPRGASLIQAVPSRVTVTLR